MTRILLVEDDKTIALALKYALEREGYDALVSHDGLDGLTLARTSAIDLILLDVMLPKMSGLELARALRESGDDVPIIMLTALENESDKIAGLDSGADDYITKPFSTNELFARIRAQLRRTHRDASKGGIVEVGALKIDFDTARVEVSGKTVKLRLKEYQLLKALVMREGALCTRTWISQEVWGETFLRTSRTIDTHVRRLRKAIETDGWTYIQTERGMGYRFEAIHEG